MSRVFIIVLDGVGAGEAPDASEYGDQGSNTLGNLARAVGGLHLPLLEAMGFGNIAPIEGLRPVQSPLASHGRMQELSAGKDTVTGHWEMMGIVNPIAFPTYPNGFPSDLMAEFERLIERKTLCNCPASGTEVIARLGDEHLRTGAPIVYTSADSVFQIAAHEKVIPVDELYKICETARALLVPPHGVCRVIARPFIGPPFERTPRRKDYALLPPERTVCDVLREAGMDVISIGKVSEMFAGRGFSKTIKTKGNTDGMATLNDLLFDLREGLAFCNLVDFDMLYGHRNDTKGFYQALRDFDLWLGSFLPRLKSTDTLIITADHGLDPTTPSTDHSREFVPVLCYRMGAKHRDLGLRMGFCDVGATVLDALGVNAPLRGTSLFSI